MNRYTEIATSNRPSGRTEYPYIDIVKLLMAVCVVAIHTHPLEHCSNLIILSIYDTFTNCAVPFFFLSTGFLLGKRMGLTDDSAQKAEIVRRQLHKTLKLYLVFSVVYLPLAIAYYVLSQKTFLKATLLYIRGFFLIGEHYNSWMLWYLLSAAYALILILALLKRDAPPVAFLATACVIYVLSCALSALASYEAALPPPISIFRLAIKYSIGNGRILRGGFYIPIGILLSDRPLSGKTAWGMFVPAFAVCCVLKGFANALFLGVCAVGFFSIIIDYSIKCGNRPKFAEYIYIYIYMRNVSVSIYFTHLYIWTICYTLLYGETTYGFLIFAVTLFFTLIPSLIYASVKTRKLS